MSTPMTMAQWAENEAYRIRLLELVNDPVMQAAFDTLKEANLPSMVIHPDYKGMEPSLALALMNAQRSGGVAMLKSLSNIPYLTNQRAKALKHLNDPALEEPTA